MLILDPRDAYRRLDQQAAALDQRNETATEWGASLNRDYEILRPSLGDGGEFDAFAHLNDAMWAVLDEEYDAIETEYLWVDAQRAALDAELTAAGEDWRDYDYGERDDV